MGIRQKSIILHLVASFIPLILLAGISYYTVSNILKSVITDALIATSQETMANAENYLAETVLDIAAWTRLVSMQDVLMDDHWGAIAREIGELKERYQQIAVIAVANDHGVVVASTGRDLIGADIHTDPAFMTAFGGSMYQARSVSTTRFGSRPGIVVAAAVRANYSATTNIGVLVAVIDWVAIADRFGSSLIIGQAQDHDRRLILVDRRSGDVLFDGDSDHPIPQLPPTVAFGGVVAEVEAEGNSFLAGMALSKPTGALADPGWAVYALVEREAAYAMVHDYRDNTLMLVGTQAVLVLVLGYFAAGHFTRPIEAVTKALQQVAAGETAPIAFAEQRTDEIGKMVEALEVFRANLTKMQWLTMEKARIAARGRLLLAEAFEALMQPVSVWDPADTFVLGNPAFDRMVASSNWPLAAVGDSFADLKGRVLAAVAPADGARARLTAAWADVAAKGGGVLTLPLADGRTFRMSERRTADGSRVVSFVDVTEFRRREEGLAILTHHGDRVETDFAVIAAEALARILPFRWVGVASWDGAAGTARIIAMACEPGDEIDGNLALSDDFRAALRGSDRICAIGEEASARFPADIWLGDRAIEAFVGAPYFDAAGRTIGHVFAMSDMPAEFSDEALHLVRVVARWVEANHERAQAEDELRRMNEDLEDRIAQRTRELQSANNGLESARQLLIDAIESISEGFVLWDAEDRLLLCNSHYREMYETLADVLIPGTPFAVVAEAAAIRQHPIAEQDRESWIAQRLNLHRTGGEAHEQTMHDGRIILVSEHRTSEGGIVGVRTDITRLKLMQAQLVQASKLATLGEMATGIAHEINQPLTVMRMAAEKALKFIERGGAEHLDQVTEKIGRVMAQIDRARSITDHMRTFGRSAPEKTQPLALKAVAESAIALIGEQLGNHDITVTLTAEAAGDVLGSQIQLEQVVVNLLANARDAVNARREREGPEAPRAIAIRVGVEGTVAVLSVEDSGGGIDPKVIPRIFDPFFTTKEVGKGTGLGLSISYGIVTSMGGTLRAENIDQGALFILSMPAIAGGNHKYSEVVK